MFDQLIEWSRKQYSHLPWREKRTLYGTLVSEIMLQQTTVGTVLNKFDSFMSRFPSIDSLARATEEEVLSEWKGLGYYRRARNLKKASESIIEKFQGEIPLNKTELMQINGIGEYTASALISIGANKPAIAVDANLERVLSRFYGYEDPKGPKLQRRIQAEFSAHKIISDIEKIGPRKLNEAFMDLGRVICKSSQAFCQQCPIADNCQALKKDLVEKIPNTADVKKIKFEELSLLRIICKKKEKIAVTKRKNGLWLEGQLELPTFILNCTDSQLQQYPWLENYPEYFLLPSFKSTITKYKITNYVLYLDPKEHEDVFRLDSVYFSSELSQLSTSSIKALNQV